MTPLVMTTVLIAGILGVTVAGIGVASELTWGTGYGAARAIITGPDVPHWFGIAKLAATLATAVSGMPGGIFAPSLAVGAGVGDMLRRLFPTYPAGAIVLLGMFPNSTGVVRAPPGHAPLKWRGICSVGRLSLELGGAEVVERRVAPHGVVEAVDIAGNGLPGLGAGVEDGAPDELGFDRLEERLDHGVIEAVALARHGDRDAVAA